MLSSDDNCILSELIINYACALDARDWPLFRSLFTDQVELDYGAIGSIVGMIDADAWTTRCDALSGFDATLHRISNVRRATTDDGAVGYSYIDALHFIAVDDETIVAHLTGRYEHGFRRDADGQWRISRCALHVAGYPNGQDNFARGFAAARQRYAGG